MARPQKNNADYFPHDSGMRNDRRVKALRSKFKHVGYSVYLMLIESLTDADFFELDFDGIQIELLAGDFDVDSRELCDIVDYCCKLGLVQGGCGEGKLWSERHKKNFESLLYRRDARRNDVPDDQNPVMDDQNPEEVQDDVVMDDQNPVSDARNPQNKVKESKGKERKETIINEPVTRFVPPTLQEVNSYFSEKGLIQEAAKFFDYYESNGWRVGKNKMQKWKNAASGWISRSASSQKTPTPSRQDKKEQNTDARERLAEEILAKKYGITRTGDGGNKGVVGQIQG